MTTDSKRPRPPLGIRNGLNPTRARVPVEHASISAFDFVWHLKNTQRRIHPDDTADALLAAFEAGEVRAGLWPHDTALTPNSRLPAGTDVWFYRMPAEELQVPYTCEILHEDDRLLVVNKPPYLATMPRGKHITQTATVQLRRSTGNDELAPAHRLDRLTSGVLVFTKRREFRGAYQDLFAKRRAYKTYEAIADFDQDLQPGIVWRSRMEKTAGEIQGRIVPGEPNAITKISNLKLVDAHRQRRLSKIFGPLPPQGIYELKPATGRTHQLRLHMWAAGLPILGDPAYPYILPEEEEDFQIPMCLNASELRFVDPIDGKLRVFSCAPRW